MIPIIILTKDNSNYLELTIKGIINNSLVDYELHIIDNSNSSECIQLNKIISSKYNAKYQHFKNKWILSIGNYFKINIQYFSKYKYFICTDDDVVLDKIDKCPINELVKLMDDNIYLAKIGVSLRYNKYKNILPKDIAEMEESYYAKYLVKNIVYDAPVDTTFAIYRYESFMAIPFTSPYHNYLIKPTFRIGRSVEVTADHIGWNRDEYIGGNNSRKINEKILCLINYNGYINKKLLKNAPLNIVILNKFRPIIKIYWKFHLIIKIYKIMLINNFFITTNK